ncbi:type VI secretion system (T6SS) ImpG/VasA family protein [Pantoea sp. AG1095]|nr:type VI secretion system (T6SS) ImpG/VasA family protein [Pantoea sp. AG1095]
MKDLTLRYYDTEMRYLRDAAKEFAATHPDRAAMLTLTGLARRTRLLNVC